MEFEMKSGSNLPLIFLGYKDEPAHWIAQTSGFWTVRVFIVRARFFEGAWERVMEWLHEYAPEEFERGNELYAEAYADAIEEGMSEEEAHERAGVDLVYDDGGYLPLEEWHGGELRNRAEVKAFVSRCME